MDHMEWELLAPAGSLEAFIAAVENGADAVYLGGKQFNARAYADNFSEETMRDLIAYAHERNIKTFVTLNTLLFQEELSKVIPYIEGLYTMGTDGVIVQDYGIIQLLNEYFPNFRKHASTQMTVHDSRTVQELTKLHINRVVLSREMSLPEVQAIACQTEAELEVFVHGALCFCYSGQCLMSSFIGGRSGNRGRCAQPCRKVYKTASYPKGRYELSLKDNASLSLLKDLMKSGVKSFKIEGRMKRPEYVGLVTRIYRKAMDAVKNDTFDRLNLEEEEDHLRRVFNRDFHPSYFLGKSMEQFEKTTPLNHGLLVGKAGPSWGKSSTQLISKEPIRNGDGLRIVTKGGTAYGLNVSGIDDKGVISERIPEGSLIYKTYDKEAMDEIRKTYVNREGYFKKVPVKLAVTAKFQCPLTMSLTHPLGNHVTVSTSFSLEKAKKTPTDPKKALYQLTKFGGTPFYPDPIEARIDEGLMIPYSECNELRRRAVELLMASFREERPFTRPSVKLPRFHTENPIRRVGVYVESDVRHKVSREDFLILETQSFQDETFIENLMEAKKRGIPYYLSLPPILKDEEYYLFLGGEDIVEEASGIFVSNLGQRAFMEKTYGSHAFFASHHMNVTNGFALKFLLEQGFLGFEPSWELRLDELRDMTIEHLFLFVQGKIPVMITEQSLTENLTDEKGMVFPVKQKKKGRSILYNPKELCVVQDIPAFLKAGIGNFIIRHTFEEEPIEEWVKGYQEKIKTGQNPHWTHFHDTRGHFFRGVE